MAPDSTDYAVEDRDAGETLAPASASARLGTPRRAAITLALVAVLGGFAGIIWYAYDRYSLTMAEQTPLIQADPSPVRVPPEDPGGLRVDHRDRLVLGNPAGDEGAADALRPGPEQPMEPPRPSETLVPLASSQLPVFASNPDALPSAAPDAPDAPDAPPQVVAAPLAAGQEPPAEALIERRAEPVMPGLALDRPAATADARTGRMVPITPLGIIGPAAAATADVVPAQGQDGQPNQPALSAEAAEALALLGRTPEGGRQPHPSRVEQIMALAAAMPDNPVALSRALAASGRGGPALDDAGEPADGQDAGYRRSSGTYRVQLAAVTARDAAEEEWRRLNRLHGDLLSGLELHVETVDVDGRDYHRIQAGPVDPQAARALCDAIRERGADCLVRP